MKLYDLVTFKQALKRELDTTRIEAEILALQQRIGNIKTQVEVLDVDYLEYLDVCVDYCDTLIANLAVPNAQARDTIAEIDVKITKLSHKLFADSFVIESNPISVEHVRTNRRIRMYEDTEQVIKQKIMLYTNWRYPALEIGCRDGEWTQFLVASDPLYIMDQHTEFLDTATAQFPAQYQSRIRKYPLKNYDFSALPKNQFAFVFSWGHFNFTSLDTTTQVLKQLRELMRPGGVFLFSYNDGDTPAGAGMAENMAATYLPKSILIPTCESIGFEVVADCNHGPNVTWLEIKKPGVLHTVKAHQVLGEIKNR